MSDGPSLLRTGSHERRLPARRRNVEHELDPEAPDGVDDRVDLRVVLARLELDDARLRNTQLLGQSSLAELVLRPIPQQGGRKLPGRGEPLPLRSEAGVGELLLRHQRIKGLLRSRHRYVMIIPLLLMSTATHEAIPRRRDRSVEILLLGRHRKDHELLPKARVDRPNLASPLLRA